MIRRAFALGVSTALFAVMAGTSALAQDAAHPVHIHAGACPTVGDVIAPLNDLVLGNSDVVGAGTAMPVEASSTIVELSLADIVAAPHAINAHESAEAIDNYIACGDIGGQMLGDDKLAIGLGEVNGSGHMGVAWLQDMGDGKTQVDVFLVKTGAAMPGESPAAMPGESPAAMPGESVAP